MADYSELLRRAISALPENNGAARRAVYEKARSALVGQLRAITPPLPARDITQHRLQLEDCIRQVEQAASEAVITLGRDQAPAPTPAPVVASVVEAPKAVTPIEPRKPTIMPGRPQEPARSQETKSAQTAIEDIISAAEQAEPNTAPAVSKPSVPSPASAAPAKADVATSLAKPEAAAPAPATPRPEPAKPVPTTPAGGLTSRPVDRPSFEPRREPETGLVGSRVDQPARAKSATIEPRLGGLSAARLSSAAPIAVAERQPVEAALSSVREVEVEPSVVQPDTREAEGAIERAIETLDREARGEISVVVPETADRFGAGRGHLANGRDMPDEHDGDIAQQDSQRRGSGLTIFLIVFAVLLVGVAGAGLWAWREGYVDLNQMFGRSIVANADATPVLTDSTPTLDAEPVPTAVDANGGTVVDTGQGTAGTETLEPADRLEPTPTAVVPPTDAVVLPDVGAGEDRLPVESTVAVNDPAASVDPAVLAGSQSLLLEASPDGRTGAVPFSGTVEWTEGVDEIGLPTLRAKASIPARNLNVDLTIRKNSDPSLPASHLMEINFQVSDTFIGGSISSLPGVLLKDEELVQGTPLAGASARIVGSSFLFALSAAEKDLPTNVDLLTNRKWIDFAVIYGTGTRAIITLEKDEAATALFTKVFAAWTAGP